MKFSSLFHPTYGIIRSIIALLLGLSLVIWPGVAVDAFVRILGAVMILVGGVALGINFLGKERLGFLFASTGIIAVVFGIILLAFPDFFVNLLSYLFGILMLFFSIGEIATLLSAGKYTKVKFAFYIIPILIFLAGIFLIVRPMDAAKAVFIFFGIALMFYAVFEFVLAIKFSKVFKAAEQEAAVEAAKEEATDVEVIESKPLIEEAAEEPSDVTQEEQPEE
ncbi:MAG: DUF308 domain-containing protein [Bacteroidales bacterium]|nr:DUF308 domain-containing protein [Bacteroidales bacterium]MBO7585267.1 DUF308 domain-containing protein [Bacteroidales bacterium]